MTGHNVLHVLCAVINFAATHNAMQVMRLFLTGEVGVVNWIGVCNPIT